MKKEQNSVGVHHRNQELKDFSVWSIPMELGFLYTIFPHFRRLQWGFPTSRNVPYTKLNSGVICRVILDLATNSEVNLEITESWVQKPIVIKLNAFKL